MSDSSKIDLRDLFALKSDLLIAADLVRNKSVKGRLVEHAGLISRLIAERVSEKSTTQPAAGEPIQVEAVAVTRARKNGGLALEWLIEGGISALEAPGVVLLVAHGTVIDDQGSGEVYLAPPAAAHGDEAVRKDAEAAYVEMTCQPVLIDGAHHYYLSSERMQAFDRLFSVDVSDAAMRAQGYGHD